jgi:GNAT superfamily N-acetyltransferase
LGPSRRAAAKVTFPTKFLEDGRRRQGWHQGLWQDKVDDWLSTKVLQHQEKHLSVTKVLLEGAGAIAGYYTLATGQVELGDLPAGATNRLPRRALSVAVLAWLGAGTSHQGQGLGRLLQAQALRDCHEAGQTFAFIVVLLDCVNDAAKAFYQHFDFEELPGHPYRLFLSAKRLAAMIGPR